MIPERREAILAALADGPKTTSELVRITGINAWSIRLYGRHLVEEGAVRCDSLQLPGRGQPSFLWRMARWMPHGSRAA